MYIPVKFDFLMLKFGGCDLYSEIRYHLSICHILVCV